MSRLMLVDDEAIITMQLEERLKFMGYEVVGSASSGEEALNKARCLKPDLILMDIVMPGKLDGIDASEIIKKELDIPVIFLTGYMNDEFIMRAKKAEPFGYICKPFQEGQVKTAIEIALQRNDIYKVLCEKCDTLEKRDKENTSELLAVKKKLKQEIKGHLQTEQTLKKKKRS